MNKLLLTSLLILGIVGVGVYLFTSQTRSPLGLPMTSTPTSLLSGPQSLTAFLNTTSSQQCTINDSETESTGKLYVASRRIASTFTTMEDSVELNNRLIITDDTMYTWQEGTNEGVMFSLSVLEELAQTQTEVENPQDATLEAPLNWDEQVDVTCQNWRVDESMFEIPVDIEFTDASIMFEQVNQLMESIDMGETPSLGDMCATCAALPSEAQVECQTALGCL